MSPQYPITTNRISYDSYGISDGSIASSIIGFEGYCPVSIVSGNKWLKGNRGIVSTYDNTLYYFASESDKATFERSPERFVPALGGDCVVCFEGNGSRITGSVHHSAVHKDRLYLFPGETEKKMFMQNPVKYADVDLASHGNCIVSRVNHSQSIMGSPEHQMVRNGLRYWFESEAARKQFQARPAKFEFVTVATLPDFEKDASETVQ